MENGIFRECQSRVPFSVSLSWLLFFLRHPQHLAVHWKRIVIWDYQQKRPTCGHSGGLKQYPKPLDHHPLTKWTQKTKCSYSLYHYTYPVTSFLFGSQVKQLFFLFQNFFYSIYLVSFFTDHGTSPPAAMYETYYVTAHKQPCRAASFSQNGKMISNRADVKNGNR